MTLPAYNEQTLADAVAQKTAERILMSQAADCWITAKDYCKRWKVSLMHLFRHKEYFKRNKAVDGKGKMLRYNKFFSPTSGTWHYK